MFALLLMLSAQAKDVSLHFEPGVKVRYHAESLFGAGGQQLIARQNLEAGAIKLGVVMDLGCVPAAARKGWQLTCDIETADLVGQAVPGEQEKLDRILAEQESTLASGTLVVDMAEDGRITRVTLSGLPTDDERSSHISEVLRQVCRRALAPLDVERPKDGEVGEKPWKQGGTPLAAELFVNAAPVWTGAGSNATPMAGGVSGGLSLKHVATKLSETGLLYSTEGKGNVAALVTDTATSYAHIDISGSGRLMWDGGQVAYATLTVTAQDNASVTARTLADGYTQSGWIARWNADGSLEGPEGTIKPEPPVEVGAVPAPPATAPAEGAPTGP